MGIPWGGCRGGAMKYDGVGEEIGGKGGVHGVIGWGRKLLLVLMNTLSTHTKTHTYTLLPSAQLTILLIQ
jgi:hypothetical protein